MKKLIHAFSFCIIFMSLRTQAYSLVFDPEAIPEFHNVRLDDQTEIVQRTFRIQIPGFPYIYNPSLLRTNHGYLLAFRYDDPKNRRGHEKAFIGLVELNHEFKPISTPKLLDTGNTNSEDPRLFATRSGTYLSYSHRTNIRPVLCNIGLCKLDAEKKEVLTSVDLTYTPTPIEKNWTPFVVQNFHGKDDIFFVYSYLPHRIIKLSHFVNGTTSIAYENSAGEKELTEWQKKWGLIRGGTPGLLLGDEYISFFHSSFPTSSGRYYVFGAITFDAHPPFAIKKISKIPIFFKGMYSTAVTTDVWFHRRRPLWVIFPSGIVPGEEFNRQVFYVVCGENDVAIKCIVIDKEHLLTSLEPVSTIP